MVGYAYAADARLRARVPRRALPHRPGRGRGADGRGKTARPTCGGAAEACRRHRLAAGGDGTRGGLRRSAGESRRSAGGSRGARARGQRNLLGGGREFAPEAGRRTSRWTACAARRGARARRAAGRRPEARATRRRQPPASAATPSGGAGRPRRRGGDAARAAHAPSAAGVRGVRGLDRRLPVPRAAQARRRQRGRPPDREGRQMVGGGRRRLRGGLVRRLRGPVPDRLRPRPLAHLLAGQLPDHDGRAWSPRACSPPPGRAASR